MNNIEVPNHDQRLARYSYESLILQQSHIPFSGLWTNGLHYYAVCPNLNDSPLAANGEPLGEWFDQKCRAITSPITIVQAAPENAIKDQQRTAEELSQIHGEPLTISDVSRELISALPKNFPEFGFNTHIGKAKFYVEKPLSEDEMNILIIIYANLNLSLRMEILVENKSGWPITMPIKGPDALALISSKGLSNNTSRLVKEGYEEDEEFWIDKRLGIFSTELID